MHGLVEPNTRSKRSVTLRMLGLMLSIVRTPTASLAMGPHPFTTRNRASRALLRSSRERA
jgi:hypothetical protein